MPQISVYDSDNLDRELESIPERIRVVKRPVKAEVKKMKPPGKKKEIKSSPPLPILSGSKSTKVLP